MKDKILEWFVTGKVGASSRAMASCIAGFDSDRSHPHDPDDLNRCLLFLEAVPEARERLGELRGLSRTWAKLVDRWDELEAQFLDEVGLNWHKARSAPKTYQMMNDIGC